MPREKPTTKIDVIGNLDPRPEKAVGDFAASKQQNEFFVKPPNWDSAGNSIELLYIQNGREHQAMLRLQEEMLAHQKQQNAINSMRLERIHKSQGKLRRRYIEVNNFVRDCADKRKYALKKISDEVFKHEQISKNVKKYDVTISELNEFRNKLTKTVNEFEPYEKVIQEVVEQSEIYDSIKDCIDRCDALMLAQVEIQKEDMNKLNEIENVRKHMVKVTKAAALTVLGLKNALAELERSYTNERMECLKWEKIFACANAKVAEKNLNKQRALDGIHHIYHMLCHRRGFNAKTFRTTPEQQMDFIKDEVEILREVLKEYSYLNKKIMEDDETPTEKQTIKC